MSDSLKFACPYCDKVSRVPASFAGKRGKCPKCKSVIEVPDPDADAEEREPALKDASGPGGDARDEPGADETTCTFCGEPIKKVAKKCKHCGEYLDRRLRERKREERTSGGDVHIVLKIWGVLIMILAGLSLLGSVVNTLTGNPGGVISIVVQIIVLRLGYGLMQGQRSAVVGVCIIAGLGVLVALAGFAVEPAVGVIVLGLVSLFYGPPIVVGFMQWDQLGDGGPPRRRPTGSPRRGPGKRP